MIISELLQSCISVILPMRCISCDSRSAIYPLPICTSCKNNLLAYKPPEALSSENLKKIFLCRAYEGTIRECIKTFKYYGNMELLKIFKEIISTFLSSTSLFSSDIDLVLPVPMYPGRRLARGYNQAELIARVVCSETSLPSKSRILIKTKNTASQMSLSKNERIKNLKHSFVVADRLNITGKSILLVDDIITTGATLEACAGELLRSGARSVEAFTLARTL